MKRGTPDHPKVDGLMDSLSIPRYAAVGLLESLWHMTMRYAVAGDIGKFTDEQIARRLGWDGEAQALVAALLANRWLDVGADCRLVVHDWHEHADQTVKRYVASKGLAFASLKLARDSNTSTSTRTSTRTKPVAEPEEKPARVARSFDDLLADFPALNTSAFREAWELWTQHRVEKKSALKPTTIQAQIKKLAKVGPDVAIAMIMNSIEQGYTGLFEPNGKPAKTSIPLDNDYSHVTQAFGDNDE